MQVVIHLQLCSGLQVQKGSVEEGPVCLFEVELLADRVGDCVLY